MGNSTINSGTSGSTQYAEHPVTTQPTTGNPPPSTSTPQPATETGAPPNASQNTLSQGGQTSASPPKSGASGSENPNTTAPGASQAPATTPASTEAQDSYTESQGSTTSQDQFLALLNGEQPFADPLSTDAWGSSADAGSKPSVTLPGVMQDIADSDANAPAVMTTSTSSSSGPSSSYNKPHDPEQKKGKNRQAANGNVNPNEAQASRPRTLGAPRTPPTPPRSASPQSVWTPVTQHAANTATSAKAASKSGATQEGSKAETSLKESVVVSKKTLERQEQQLAKQALAKQGSDAGSEAHILTGAGGTETAAAPGETGDSGDSTTTKNKKADNKTAKNNAAAKPDSPLAKLVAETTAGLLKSMQNVAENAPRIAAQMVSAALAVDPQLAKLNKAKDDSCDSLSLTALFGVFAPQGSSSTEIAGSALGMISNGRVSWLKKAAEDAGLNDDAILLAAREFGGKFSGVGYSAVQKHALGEASSEDPAHASSDSSSRTAAVASNSPRAYDPLKPEQLEILNRGGTGLDTSEMGGLHDRLSIYAGYTDNTNILAQKNGDVLTGLPVSQSLGHTNDRLQGPLASV